MIDTTLRPYANAAAYLWLAVGITLGFAFLFLCVLMALS